LPPRKREQPRTADVFQDGGLQQGCIGTCIAESNIKHEPNSSALINGSGQKRRLSNEELNGTTYASKSLRTSYSSDNPLFVLPASLKVDHEAKPDLSLIDQSERNSSQSIDKDQIINGRLVPASSVTPFEQEDPIKKFNRDIAHWVMQCMNTYYQFPNNRHTCIRKIMDKYEYEAMAKDFSRKFRQSEKESYLQVYRTFDGLEINLDMKDRIKLNIDMEFENKPLLPLE